MRVLVVLKHPEPAIQSHVDARRLDHSLVVGVNLHPLSGNLRLDIPVTQQHQERLPKGLFQAFENLDIHEILRSSTCLLVSLEPLPADKREL